MKIVDYRLTTLFADCGWTRFADITPDGFRKWRSINRERHGAKTLNDYLGTCTSFINWAERCDRVKRNPLRHLERVQVRGHERVKRRALTEAELRRLVIASGPERGLVYFFSGRTGLRRHEMKSATVADIHMHEATPFVMVRASAAKNRKEQPLPLIPELVERLRAAFPEGTPGSQRLFPRLPKMPRFYRDLEAAGIPRRDSDGLIVDFHSLRHTWNTFLHCHGVPLRQAQALMRHSDPKLTGMVALGRKRAGSKKWCEMQGLNLRPTGCNVLLINCLAAHAKEGMHKYTHNWPRTQIGRGWPMRGRGSALRFVSPSSRWSRQPSNPLGPDEAVCPIRSGLALRSAGL